ncbi:outer membrane protein assembly factor BamB family protein [Cumulibacter manganitolerans]|uniref:outer membrane protein assembly factor BamB family protein n=1 Tax=Cumulibacter manganitolerans TaxID=1884992 RepID=UPI001296C6D9|nr:PQQ-binding-like beta-propeller repeat protein [Cumulibacter manganitolerans]
MPRPWPVRLAGWALALTLLAVAALVVTGRGSFAATTHTVAKRPLADDPGEPADAVTEVHRFPAGSHLVGPAVVRIGSHGAIAYDPDTGDEVWRYLRADAAVCAQRAEGTQVVLLYRSGERCTEAIALDVRSGERRWQRTVEAAGQNTIVWNTGGFLSVDAAKMIVFEVNQGYERFTLDNSTTDHIEGEHTSCENTAASGATDVVTLQRCRATDDEPWVAQLVVNAASDGDPREVGRSYLTGIAGPELIGSLEDGTAYVRDSAGAVHVYAAGAATPVTVAGLPPVPADVRLLGARGGSMLTDGATVFRLDQSGAHVAWSATVVAPPSQRGNSLYLPTAGGIEVRAADTGQVTRTIAAALPPHAAEVTVGGPRIGVLRDDGLVVLR